MKPSEQIRDIAREMYAADYGYPRPEWDEKVLEDFGVYAILKYLDEKAVSEHSESSAHP